jgi:hypothetical protein
VLAHAHQQHGTDLMSRAVMHAEAIAGLLVALALLHPSGRQREGALGQAKLKENARTPRREPGRGIRGGGEDAGLPFDEFIAVAITGRQRVAPDIGPRGPQAVGTSPAAGEVLIRLQVPDRRPHAQGEQERVRPGMRFPFSTHSSRSGASKQR